MPLDFELVARVEADVYPLPPLPPPRTPAQVSAGSTVRACLCCGAFKMDDATVCAPCRTVGCAHTGASPNCPRRTPGSNTLYKVTFSKIASSHAPEAFFPHDIGENPRTLDTSLTARVVAHAVGTIRPGSPKNTAAHERGNHLLSLTSERMRRRIVYLGKGTPNPPAHKNWPITMQVALLDNYWLIGRTSDGYSAIMRGGRLRSWEDFTTLVTEADWIDTYNAALAASQFDLPLKRLGWASPLEIVRSSPVAALFYPRATWNVLRVQALILWDQLAQLNTLARNIASDYYQDLLRDLVLDVRLWNARFGALQETVTATDPKTIDRMLVLEAQQHELSQQLSHTLTGE